MHSSVMRIMGWHIWEDIISIMKKIQACRRTWLIKNKELQPDVPEHYEDQAVKDFPQNNYR